MSQRNEHPSLETPPAGSIRFNTDSSKLELYNGEQWWNIDSTSPEEQTGGGRGLFGGGAVSPGSGDNEVNTIDFITISTTGNASDFGDLTVKRDFVNSCSSRTRGFFLAGTNPGVAGITELDSVTIASEGNAVDFGDNVGGAARTGGGISNQTRGIIPGVNGLNTIEYFTMATTGTTEDFGDQYTIAIACGSVSSPTRGVSAGGESPSYHNVIQYLTISTTGNTADFGDLSQVKSYVVGADSATRGLFMTGYLSPSNNNTNTIEYITIASLGNAIDFGDTAVAARGAGGTSDCKRAVVTAGHPGYAGSISYVQIATLGDATDFGDQAQARRGMGGCSNAHGGLG